MAGNKEQYGTGLGNLVNQRADAPTERIRGNEAKFDTPQSGTQQRNQKIGAAVMDVLRLPFDVGIAIGNKIADFLLGEKTPQRVMELQETLQEQGKYSGPVDGEMNEELDDILTRISRKTEGEGEYPQLTRRDLEKGGYVEPSEAPLV